jgi:hypothetical protein
MGIFDFLKSQWSAGTITPEDRQKMFWYLKRKTSYTAWKRESDVFDRFAKLFGKQVKEQPHAPGYMGGTDWPDFYPRVLKAQVCYEQGLDRLKQGDRTVWLYNERGILDDATTISSHWHCELINNGMRGDHTYDGKYVEEMKQAMRLFFIAKNDTGYIQPMMACTPAPEFWGEFLIEKINTTNHPLILPDVPVPENEIVVRTDEEVPVFGIYEPQIKEGCLNYLLAGTPAPVLWGKEAGQQFNVKWRLIWEDKRYLDGTVPIEEMDYFPPEAEAKIITELAKIPVEVQNITAFTEDQCPKEGNWVPIGQLDGKIKLKKGDVMPRYLDGWTTWVWVE